MKRPLSLIVCILIPIIILLIGIISGAMYAVKTIPEAFGDDFRGVAPPKIETVLEKPGRYLIWIYHSGRYEGQLYESSGGNLIVTDKRSGDELPLNNWSNQTKSLNDERAVLAGSFETLYPNQTVQILPIDFNQETVIGISSRGISHQLRAIFSIVAIFLISVLLAVWALIVLLQRRYRQIRLLEDEKL